MKIAGSILAAGLFLACAAVNVASPAKLPIAEGMPDVRLPHAKEATLENGLRVLVLEGLDAIPTFTACMVFIDGGGLYEPPQRRGLAGFTAQMLREGTSTRSSQEVARQLETLGATLEAEGPLDSATSSVTVSGLATRFDQAMDLFADVIRHPLFAENEIARYASRTVSELALMRARPEFLSQEQLQRLIYRDHPAALAAPPATALQATNRDDLQRFHAAHYRPNGAVLVVIGAVKLGEVLPEVRRVFGDWEKREVDVPAVAPVPEQHARSVHLIDRPGSVQTVIQMGVIGIERNDPDFFALTVMNEILGGQSSSRLYQNLRERNGYTYGAYSGFDAKKIAGLWQITTSVRTDVTQGALRELLAELTRIREEAVKESELENAKRALVGKFIFSLERPQALLDNLVTQALYGLPADYWDTYAQKVAAVTAPDVARVARRILDLHHLQTAIVGDATKIRAGLADFGPVQSDVAPTSADAGTRGE